MTESPLTAQERDVSSLRMPWKYIAIAGWITAVALLLAVAFVTTSAEGALAVLALSLAIVAFFIQILVFVVQMTVAAQFEARAGRLLGEIRTSVTSLEGFLQQQFNSVLQKAFERTVVESKATVAATPESPEFSRLLKQNIEQALQGLGITSPVAGAGRLAQPATPVAAQARHPVADMLESFPEDADEGVAAYRQLVSFSPDTIEGLRRLGHDEIDSLRTGLDVGLGYIPEWRSYVDDLIRDGLAELIDNPSGHDDPPKWVRLTDPGRAVARLLTAIGPVPRYLLELAPPEELSLGSPPSRTSRPTVGRGRARRS